jgi:N-acetylglucosaminyl-diphospho-decaprenol L-rhamnosyltransferase
MQSTSPILRVVPRGLDVDVGVVYTHERQWMPRLLSSLCASAEGLHTRLILVDNDSADGAEAWEGFLPHTTTLRNRRRLYYAANLNRILQASVAPYILLLNTDLYFDPGEQCLAKMVDFMDRQPRCGIAGCRVYHADKTDAYPARRFQTISVILGRRFGLGRLMPGTLDQYLYKEHAMDGVWPCDWLSGCFMMLRREAIEEVGPFDTRFVKYFEDVDICLRMARAGWQAVYNGGTYCYHMETRGSKNLLSLDAWRHARSYVRWLQKWGFSPDRATPPTAPERRAA